MHFHVPFHPLQHRPDLHPVEMMNLVLILLGMLLALLLGPVHLD